LATLKEAKSEEQPGQGSFSFDFFNGGDQFFRRLFPMRSRRATGQRVK
jgi:hypothetical protein